MNASDPYFLDSLAVKKAFNRAAPHYSQVAHLQRQVAAELAERLTGLTAQPQTVLELGCGSGELSRQLMQLYPSARIYALDIALQMLRQISSASLNLICADAAALPLPAASVDIVVSNLMLQWCNDFLKVFQEFARVLRPGGILLFSTFGPETLQELRAVWTAADHYTHVNTFVDMRALGDALLQLGFAHPVMDAERLKRYYPDSLSLMWELKALGAHNATRGRPRGLMGKNRLQTVQQVYETYRQTDGLPASFEIIYGYAKQETEEGKQKTQNKGAKWQAARWF